jgi:hypothetical protein
MMPTDQAAVPPHELLKAVERLSPPDLEQFVSEVLDLRARRIAPTLPPDEGELLAQISQGSLPPDQHRRYHELRRKLRAETISEEEHAELLRLSDEAEMRNARRIEALGRLAQLRRKSFPEVMDELGIKPCTEGDDE